MADISREIAERVQAARAGPTPLYLTAGGSKRDCIGRPCEAEDLDLCAHRGIVDYQPDELVLTVRCGTPLADIDAVLAERGQCLSFEPPRYTPSATIGGTVACNLSGPARPWGGSARDMVLGARLVDGRGEMLRFGGQVMKNVAGYDVSRFLAGSLGVLGVITELSLKVLPRHEASDTRVLELDAPAAVETMNRLAAQPGPLDAAVWLDGRLYLRASGTTHGIAPALRAWGGESLSEAAAFWQALRDHELPFFNGNAPLWRFSVRSSAPVEGYPEPLLIDWCGAQRWLRGEHDRKALQDLARAGGGHVSLFRGGDRDGEVKPPLSPPEQDLHRRLKRAFDPDGILNPGRMYGWM
jgi:glycolate oxidase FAD binding subunit